MLSDIGDDGEFGVCLIERGSEVGGGDVRTSEGTVARIVYNRPMLDDTSLIIVLGERRFHVESWLPETPYPRAVVRFLEDDDVPDPMILATAISSVRAVRHLESEVDIESSSSSTCEFDDDPVEAGWQCCAYPHMGAQDRQSVLQQESVNDRLRLVAEICCERYGDLQRMMQEPLTNLD